MRRRLFITASALAAALAASAARAAVIEFPPAASRSFIELFEIDSGASLCHLTCDVVGSPTSSVTQAPFSLVGGRNNANFVNAVGDVSPTAMHSVVTGNIGVEYDLAFVDTYTVHGGTGPFAITVTLDADAIAGSIPAGPFQEVAGANIQVLIGNYSVDPAAVFQAGVSPFGPASEGHSAVVTKGVIGAPFSVPISATASYTRMVNPGDVFDIGYQLRSSFALGSIDASHTATINFDLPDGVFLTSTGGATFGAPPGGPGVPEPAAWTLMIAGFGLAGAAMRRRMRLA